MKNLRCFIFDLDGTLVFSEEINFLSYEAAFKKYNLTLHREDFMPYLGAGKGIVEIYTNFTKKYKLPFKQDILDGIRAAKISEYAARRHAIPQNDPIVALLRALSPHYHTALATTAIRANGLGVIEQLGLDQYFDFMVFGDDVRHCKPNPECHQIIAKHFNIQPDECMIFEDSVTGFAAAEAFGAHVCKVVK